MDRWQSYKREKRQGYKPIGWQSICSQVQGLNDEQLADCVEHSISNNYSGLFPDKFGRMPATFAQNPNGYPGKKGGGAEVPERGALVPQHDPPPERYAEAWAALYAFAIVPWSECPDANRDDVIAWIAQNPKKGGARDE
jgi:hypothetical protein